MNMSLHTSTHACQIKICDERDRKICSEMFRSAFAFESPLSIIAEGERASYVYDWKRCYGILGFFVISRAAP